MRQAARLRLLRNTERLVVAAVVLAEEKHVVIMAQVAKVSFSPMIAKSRRYASRTAIRFEDEERPNRLNTP